MIHVILFYYVCIVVMFPYIVGLSKMRAITDQQELLTNLQEKFAQRLATHLNGMFIQQVSI